MLADMFPSMSDFTVCVRAQNLFCLFVGDFRSCITAARLPQSNNIWGLRLRKNGPFKQHTAVVVIVAVIVVMLSGVFPIADGS